MTAYARRALALGGEVLGARSLELLLHGPQVCRRGLQYLVQCLSGISAHVRVNAAQARLDMWAVVIGPQGAAVDVASGEHDAILSIPHPLGPVASIRSRTAAQITADGNREVLGCDAGDSNSVGGQGRRNASLTRCFDACGR